MLLLSVLLAAAPTIVTPGGVAETAGKACPVNSITRASDMVAPMIHPLGAEPPAQSLYAVLRDIDGCNTPIVLSPQVGQPPVR